MANYEKVLVSAALIVLANERRQKQRRKWIRFYSNRRKTLINLNRELKLDSYSFESFAKMSKCDFQYLINKIGPKVTRIDTVMRKAISIATRLAITLRFLATGESYKSLAYLFKVSDCSICRIIPEVCAALNEGLKEVIKMPSSEEEWKAVAKGFEDRWNFPHCVGAMDGKHIAIKCPPNGGSKYYNYKNFYSIVIFGVVDANYKFLYVHVGCQGPISDGGDFRHTTFGRSLLDESLNLPAAEPLPNRKIASPYVFVADDAFPLTDNILKSYCTGLNKGSRRRVFNYRLSRARQVSENVFGLLALNFGILHTTIDLKLEYMQTVILTCAYLHNFLMTRQTSKSLYILPDTFDYEDINTGIVTPGSWRNNEKKLTALEQTERKSSVTSKKSRDEFLEYVMINSL